VAAAAANVLRPRSVGEILDRGFAVLVRTLPAALALTAALYSVPFLFLGWIFTHDTSSRAGFAAVFGLCDSPYYAALYSLYARALLGQPVRLHTQFATGWRRAAPVLIAVLVGTLGFFAVLIVGGALVIAGAYGISRSFPHAVALALDVAGALLVVPIAAIAVAFVSTLVSVWIGACASENVGPIAGLRLAIGRCSGSQWKRATTVGLAATVPGLLLAAANEIANMHYHWTPAIKLVTDALATAPALLVTAALSMAFAVDARIRTEGLDLIITEA
jgi:hypothetical protein